MLVCESDLVGVFEWRRKLLGHGVVDVSLLQLFDEKDRLGFKADESAVFLLLCCLLMLLEPAEGLFSGSHLHLFVTLK